MAVTVRRAKPSDAPALTDIVFRSKQSNGYDDAFMDACRGELAITGETLVNRTYWVAEDEVLLGCAALGAAATLDAGEVHAFFIDPNAQRRGVGRALWDVLRAQAINNGMIRLVLDADPAAVPFYERLGFRVVGESPSGSVPGRKIPLMEIDLLARPTEDRRETG